MSSSRTRVISGLAAAGALAALAGCASHIGEEDKFLGEAVKYDQAIRTVNPDPVYPAAAAQPGDNGDKGAHAMKRYRTDAVKPVETMQTSSGSAGAGSSAH